MAIVRFPRTSPDSNTSPFIKLPHLGSSNLGLLPSALRILWPAHHPNWNLNIQLDQVGRNMAAGPWLRNMLLLRDVSSMEAALRVLKCNIPQSPRRDFISRSSMQKTRCHLGSSLNGYNTGPCVMPNVGSLELRAPRGTVMLGHFPSKLSSKMAKVPVVIAVTQPASLFFLFFLGFMILAAFHAYYVYPIQDPDGVAVSCQFLLRVRASTCMRFWQPAA